MIKKAVKRIKDDNEKGARADLLQELFNDVNRSKAQIYQINFVRGIFFGFGSIIGGTFVVALIVALLNLLVDLPGGVGGFIQYIVDTVRRS